MTKKLSNETIKTTVEGDRGRRSIVQALGFSVADAARAAGLSRSKLYEALKAGDLAGRKAGRRTIIEEFELRRWLSNMPSWQPRGH